jgi:hypothetical protein
MKKIIASLMSASLLFPTSVAFATVVDNGDGTQTIRDETFSDADLTGYIGENIYPTEDWIKVKLPTEMIYFSTANSEHREIESSDYEVTNESVFPVAIRLTGFFGEDGESEPDVDRIEELVMNADSPINLISNHEALYPDELMFKLDASPESDNPWGPTEHSKKNFHFSGSTVQGSNVFGKQSEVNNKLRFQLVQLDENGNVPS